MPVEEEPEVVGTERISPALDATIMERMRAHLRRRLPPPGLSITTDPPPGIPDSTEHRGDALVAQEAPTQSQPVQFIDSSVYFSNLANRQRALRELAEHETEFQSTKCKLSEEYATKLHDQFRELLKRHASSMQDMREAKAQLSRTQDRVRELAVASAMQTVQISVLNRRIVAAEAQREKASGLVIQAQKQLARQETNTEAIRRRVTCVVCYNAPINTLIVHCGHLVLCSTCEEQIRATDNPKCPMCRVPYNGQDGVRKVTLP